jgi:hypothetical protein
MLAVQHRRLTQYLAQARAETAERGGLSEDEVREVSEFLRTASIGGRTKLIASTISGDEPNRR